MLKTVSILEEKIGEKVAALHLDATMTLGEVHDALHKMLQDIVGRMEAAAKAISPEVIAAAQTAEPAVEKVVAEKAVEVVDAAVAAL